MQTSFPQPQFPFLSNMPEHCNSVAALDRRALSSLSIQFGSMQGGWGEGSWERKFLGSDSSPTNSLLPLDPGTNGGGGSIYALLIEMGCLAWRVEDDSLGHEPGTLGKAKPASGQSPREQRTGPD